MFSTRISRTIIEMLATLTCTQDRDLIVADQEQTRIARCNTLRPRLSDKGSDYAGNITDLVDQTDDTLPQCFPAEPLVSFTADRKLLQCSHM